MRPVTVAASNGEQSLIGAGLAAGEKVVLEGTDRLREGSTVEVVEGAFKEATPPVAPGKAEPGANPRGERPLPADGAPARKPTA